MNTGMRLYGSGVKYESHKPSNIWNNLTGTCKNLVKKLGKVGFRTSEGDVKMRLTTSLVKLVIYVKNVYQTGFTDFKYAYLYETEPV
jgi:hypothetical protein